jgi:hypothetical protein
VEVTDDDKRSSLQRSNGGRKTIYRTGPEEDSIEESDLVLQGFEAIKKRFVNLKRNHKNGTTPL